MKITAGALKGRRLVVPRGLRTRPTADQIRIALMDTLAPRLAQARVLDLFAGAGGVGLEALSRGAAHTVFVERDAHALRALRENIAALDLGARARAVRGDVVPAVRRLGREGERFDVVFLDPPYAEDLVAPTLSRLDLSGILVPGGIVVAQHPTKRPPVETIGALRAFRTRRFGETTLTFFRSERYDDATLGG